MVKLYISITNSLNNQQMFYNYIFVGLIRFDKVFFCLFKAIWLLPTARVAAPSPLHFCAFTSDGIVISSEYLKLEN